ncbi:cysteine--tRNA ligase [Candidatus Gracilibacteria bacterium]|nr:cysteine--tRNA ligase [Candidatus Gracilibacteria bacterium]
MKKEFPTIFLYNTLTGEKNPFKPLKEGEVKMYSCGPTVYDFAHIGNFRSFLVSDLLVRVLKYAGYKVTKAQNITDVGHLVADSDDGEDKILKKARLEKKDPFAIARAFEDAFVADEKVLRILPPEFRPRATDFIPEQIALAEKLIQEGYAYEANGSVYFRTKKFKTYGTLSGNKLEDVMAGARVEVNSEKEDPLDFALWKRAEENHLMQWNSPWGRGFPGWHAECSAMSAKLLGLPFDIHTGGEDNIFPHHECEIAQNECSSGVSPSVRYWLHVKHLLVDGKKMSKSQGNFFTIRDLIEKGWKGEEIRFALLKSHYKTEFNFSEQRLEEARSNIRKIRDAYKIFKKVSQEERETPLSLDQKFEDTFKNQKNHFKRALFDDLNVPQALSDVYEMIDFTIKGAEAMGSDILPEEATRLADFLENDFDSVFDVLKGEENPEEQELFSKKVQPYIRERLKFRAEKNWEEADRIRDLLLNKFNVELKDEKAQGDKEKTVWQEKTGKAAGTEFYPYLDI